MPKNPIYRQEKDSLRHPCLLNFNYLEIVKQTKQQTPVKINAIQAEFVDRHLTNYDAGLIPLPDFLFRKLGFLGGLSGRIFCQ